MPEPAEDDRTAIHEVMLRYARGIDGRDLAVVASCFAPNAAYRGALAVGTVADALAALPAAMARYTTTSHEITRHHAVVDGDSARSVSDCTARHWTADGGCRVVVVRYRDKLARGADGWRITRRDVDPLPSAAMEESRP